jgi:hypothetical protein
VAPLGERRPPESQWIPIGDGPSNLHPAWSADGNLLYYVSSRDGFYCVWAQRLDPVSRQPSGPPVEVLPLHGASRSLAELLVGDWGLAVARDRLVIALGEKTGSLWQLEPYR